jgi:tetratricopeptide (TPR) repeat protein
MFNLAGALNETGQSKEGLALGEDALAILAGEPDVDPIFVSAVWTIFGRSLEKEHRLDESEAAYLNALNLAAGKQNWPPALPAVGLVGLSIVYLRKGEVAEADLCFEKVKKYLKAVDRRDRRRWAYFIDEYKELRVSTVENQAGDDQNIAISE